MSTDHTPEDFTRKPDPVCPSCGSQITMEDKTKRVLSRITIWQCPKCKNIEIR